MSDGELQLQRSAKRAGGVLASVLFLVDVDGIYAKTLALAQAESLAVTTAVATTLGSWRYRQTPTKDSPQSGLGYSCGFLHMRRVC